MMSASWQIAADLTEDVAFVDVVGEYLLRCLREHCSA